MLEADFLALLQRLLDDGQIDEAQAASLLGIYQRDGAPEALTPEQLIPRDDSVFDEAVILALLLLLVGSRPVESLTLTARIEATDRAHESYKEQAGRIPADNLTEWGAGIVALLAALYGVTYYIGAANLATAKLVALEVVQDEAAYISRFSDELVIRRMMGQEPSAAALLSRLALYGGMARVGMFLLSERRDGDQVGHVYQYIAVDDAGTCGPCNNAQGYYLAGDGPMPGEVCLGRGRCRCRRERVYRPDVYNQLVSNGN